MGLLFCFSTTYFEGTSEYFASGVSYLQGPNGNAFKRYRMSSLLHSAAARARQRALLTSICAVSSATRAWENALRAFPGSTSCSGDDGCSLAQRQPLCAPFSKSVNFNIFTVRRPQLPLHLRSPPGCATCNGSGHSAICRVRRTCRHCCCLSDGLPNKFAPKFLHSGVCLLGSYRGSSVETEQGFRRGSAQPRCAFTNTRGPLPVPSVLTLDVALSDNAKSASPMKTKLQFFRRRSSATLRLSRQYGFGSMRLGALALATFIAFPFKDEQESKRALKSQGKGSPVTVGGLAAKCRATCSRVEAGRTPVRLSCQGSMVGSMAEAVHGYILSMRQLTGGHAGGGFVGVFCQASSAADTLWEALKPRLGMLQGAMTEASRALRWGKAKEYLLCSDNPLVVKPYSAYVDLELRGSAGQKRAAVDELFAKAEVYGHSEVSGHKREHTILPAAHSVFYRRAEEGVAEALSGYADSHNGRGQPSALFASDAAAYHGWLAALARSIRTFFFTLASVCQRLVFALPLAAIAATAGFWLYALPYIKAGLQMVGLRGPRVLHWVKVVQRELEEIIFTSVTAAASAAGPTYVKFLQVTRPHYAVCIG